MKKILFVDDEKETRNIHKPFSKEDLVRRVKEMIG